ncbi:bifunctional [glutamine synthetase] adenylyltransferase/[glutamine synthetase]-adenylyl-L-tyrosine phosphorylase [Hwanghaeella sp.]|uniref:bifunctional [glutamine synthetase] adenylyltransferase/[glutamine synthetase]-adenylyl-L-tyrosine phosphorylase n=1 Tax=Hwanghaeella sp. TaxID=2605943 RepID=UPI003CCBD588
MDLSAIVPEPDRPPRAADDNAASVGLERWQEAAQSADRASEAAAFLAAPGGKQILNALFGNSPFLTQLAVKEIGFLLDLPSIGYVGGRDAIFNGLRNLDSAEPQAATSRALRVAKRRAALLIALADLTGAWKLDEITGTLSRLAELCLDASARHALRGLVTSGKIDVDLDQDTLDNCGYVLLGMGKLGAGELNYSSDIDIIALYEPERLKPKDPDRLRQDMVRATQTVVNLMHERTADGYVFRTDLRLRPDPGMTPLAMTVGAAESYYETIGQNWERAAMIKARPVAGDCNLGYAFLEHIRPFVWRKHLDFAAVADIHSIKRQINAHRGGGQVAIEGHNVKLGRGGIREIEFFAQTQQLIWGGRTPALRMRKTLEAIDELAAEGHTKPEAAARLRESYNFLRTLEHRLQMVMDEQTQKMPATPEGVDAIGVFMGFDTPKEFRAELLRHLRQVEQEYAHLFEDEPDLGSGGRSLVFTGVEDDPETVETLTDMGFEDASHVIGRVRVWHHGRYRSTRSERARQLLTELMPRLLESLAATTNPMQAFNRFDDFLGELPSGVQLLSLFHSNPSLLDMVSEIMGNAPRLAIWLSRHPSLLDGVISDDWSTEEAGRQEMTDTLDDALDQARDFQDVLDIVIRWANDRRFQTGVELLQGRRTGEEAGIILTSVAETSVGALTKAVTQEFRDPHGGWPGESAEGETGFAVVAFGKLGGRELAPMSDLDLVFVYNVPAEIDASDGKRALTPMVYFSRLGQRLVTAMTAQTGEGNLYEVDTRLRPNGRSGPVCTQFGGFKNYYQGEAWTWEFMALTRARPIYGPAGLQTALAEIIENAIRQPRDARALVRDVDDMRQRIRKQYPGDKPWDIKHRPGGLVDIEFIAQYLQLRHGAEGKDILSTNTGTALEKLGAAGYLDAETTEDLRSALRLWRNLQAAIRLTAQEGLDEEKAPDGQKALLAHCGGFEDFEALRSHIATVGTTVRERYRELVADPAEQARRELGGAVETQGEFGEPGHTSG